MIGNDVIDLFIADKNAWQNDRYLDKVFNGSEQGLIRSSEEPAKTLWRLWSMKESAYKLHFRSSLKRRLNPLSFSCVLIDEVHGRVGIEERTFDTLSESSDDFIHSLAYYPELSSCSICHGIVRDDSAVNLREEILDSLASSFSEHLGIDKAGMRFEKNEVGLPMLSFSQGVSRKEPCSISHHGRVGGYAIMC